MNALTASQRKYIEQDIQHLRDLGEPDNIAHAKALESALAIIDRLTSPDAAPQESLAPRFKILADGPQRFVVVDSESEDPAPVFETKALAEHHIAQSSDAAQVREGETDPEGDAILAEVSRGFDKTAAPQAQGERQFPILSQYRHEGVASIPWSIMAPHERQAQANHDQSLERLAERGGLSPCEAVAILEDRPWRQMKDEGARVLKSIIEARTPKPPAPQAQDHIVDTNKMVGRADHSRRASDMVGRSGAVCDAPAPTEAAWAAVGDKMRQHLQVIISIAGHGHANIGDVDLKKIEAKVEAINDLIVGYTRAIARVGALKRPMDREKVARIVCIANKCDPSFDCGNGTFEWHHFAGTADAIIAADAKGELS